MPFSPENMIPESAQEKQEDPEVNAKELDEEYKNKQAEKFAKWLQENDVKIGSVLQVSKRKFTVEQIDDESKTILIKNEEGNVYNHPFSDYGERVGDNADVIIAK